MEILTYLQQNSLKQLQQEFSITVTDYQDRVVLNYNQSCSPRFHPICDECRSLILRKGTWEVISRSFDRFYNWGEGVPEHIAQKHPTYQRIAAYPEKQGEQSYTDFFLEHAVVQEKRDGTLISLYHDGEDWCAATRSKAFAEGLPNGARSFAEIFWEAANNTSLKTKLQQDGMHDFTLMFELTGPENCILTPYSRTNITMIGGRHKRSFAELSTAELDQLGAKWGINRPTLHHLEKQQDLWDLVNSMHPLEEGLVLIQPTEQGSCFRVKVKNTKFVAIANMRNNRNISPKGILALIMKNEQHEYLSYFPEDRPYFHFVHREYQLLLEKLASLYKELKNIEAQKAFAMALLERTDETLTRGVLFATRKHGTTIEKELSSREPTRVAQALNLYDKFHQHFEKTT